MYNINQIPADMRGLFYGQFETKHLLAGRRVCKLWRNEIDRNNAVWIKVEGYTFAEFKEKCLIGKNIKSKNYVVSLFTYDLKSSSLPSTFLLKEMIYQIIHQANQIILFKIDSSTKQLNKMIIDAHAFSDSPVIEDFNTDHIILLSSQKFMIVNTKNGQTCFTATNVLNGCVVRTKHGVVYYTKERTLEMWDPFTRTLLFSLPIDGDVLSVKASGKWLIVKTKGQTFSVIDLDEKRLHCEITANLWSYQIKDDRLIIQTTDDKITIYDLTTPSSFVSKGRGTIYGNLFCIEADRFLEFYDFDLNQCVIPKPSYPVMDCIYNETFKRIYTIGPNNKSFVLSCYNSRTGDKVNEYHFPENTFPFRFASFRWSKYYLYMRFLNGYNWQITYVFEPKNCKFLNEFLHASHTEGDCLNAQTKTNEIRVYSFEHIQKRSIAKKNISHTKISDAT